MARPSPCWSRSASTGRAETRRAPYRVIVEGAGQTFELVYFRPRRDWIERALPPGARRIVSGRVEFYDGRLQMPHPELVLAEDEAATPPPLGAGLPADARA